MNLLKTLIVDDEQRNRLLIASLLKKHCPQVQIIGEAESADEAFDKINLLNPDLILLDIKMPEKTGFDLLRRLVGIKVAVIFITGFDEYAIQAFEFNAVDYVLKPIDYMKLIMAIQKAEEKIYLASYNNIIHFVNSLEEKTNLVQRLMLHTNDKVNAVDLETVSMVVADRGYCDIYTIHQQKYVSAKTLADYETLLKPLGYFIRVNKRYIVNIKHINSYTKGTECILSMKDNDHLIEVSRRRKNEMITLLRGIPCNS